MNPAPASPSFIRREILRIGGVGWLGVALPCLLRASSPFAGASSSASFGRAKSCILLFLSGGPPQHETFDPKSDAPAEIRGDFKSIRSAVPGIRLCETLPLTARITDRLAVIRSMTTEINSHSTSGCFMLTGYAPATKTENVPASASDWPSIAAVAGALKPSDRSPLSSVVLPETIENNGHIVWPGQNGGFMGAAWHPQLIKCDPAAARMRIEGMTLEGGLTELRLMERGDLLAQHDQHFVRSMRSPAIEEMSAMQQRAFGIIHSGASREALEIEREPQAIRDRYGRHKFGQSVLLARRLVEAGVRLVQVNWPREPGDDSSGSPLWDTHQRNAQRVREVLCPQFDGTYSTLIADLADRGLLDETLVVVMGEFGRSPTINKNGGRDHWGNVFSVVLSGAGIAGGQVVGSSDNIGAFPSERPVRPPDLAATIFHLLGIRPDHEFLDLIRRPRRVTDGGAPLREIVGA